MTSTERVLSAATHSCPGGCGTELEARLFACNDCWRLVPHHMRQNIIRTRPRKYLDAERLQAIHDAEDHLDRLRNQPTMVPSSVSVLDTPKLDPVFAGTEAALEKKELSDQLGQNCAIAYAKRKGTIDGPGVLAVKHRGKR